MWEVRGTLCRLVEILWLATTHRSRGHPAAAVPCYRGRSLSAAVAAGRQPPGCRLSAVGSHAEVAGSSPAEVGCG